MSTLRRHVTILSVCIALALATTPGNLAAADRENRKPAGFDAIPKRMQTFVDEGQIAGAVTLVADEREIVHHAAVGRAAIEDDRPMRPDTLFAVASMTKPIAATAVMILVDEGEITLDDPISKYIPEFKSLKLRDGSSPQREVTLRDVMTHTSGLGGDQRLTGSLKETAKQIAMRPLDFEPGTKWQYSPGLTVAGRVVEVAAGQPFDEFLAERIFRPLGMTETTFQLSEDRRTRLAQLYKSGPDGKSLEPTTHWIHDPADGRERGPNPSGGLFSTAADLARFYQMILNGGELDGQRILSKDAVAEMTRVQTGDLATGFTPGNGWGLGWCIVRDPQGVTAMLSPGTFGHGGAFGTQGWIDPKQKRVYVLLIQRVGLPNADASDMRNEFQRLAAEASRD